MSSNNRIVYQRPTDGRWVNQRCDASKASSVHDHQGPAIRSARTNLANQGGGELTIKGRDGKIRAKDTVSPGHDPFPPRG